MTVGEFKDLFTEAYSMTIKVWSLSSDSYLWEGTADEYSDCDDMTIESIDNPSTYDVITVNVAED